MCALLALAPEEADETERSSILTTHIRSPIPRDEAPATYHTAYHSREDHAGKALQGRIEEEALDSKWPPYDVA
jgi:hypothetical protein